ncbi:MAG: hypothetical protein KF734_10800 [Saprospiraceae bacterium]|nr:hypothetical protein [Saprospiraceae bacterium]
MVSLGRLHLVLLHLPIGFLLLAGALVVLSFWKKTSVYRPALDWSVGLGAVAAVLAAVCGWLLAQTGGYDEALLLRHQWLGFASAVLVPCAWLLRHSRWYFHSVAVAVGVVSAAGHFGGTLTHGEGFLFEKIENTQASASGLPTVPVEEAAPEGLLEYTVHVQPIMEQKCVGCHNPKKKKGGLLLDSPDGILKGGKHGPVLVAGNPDASELYRRITLPAYHDEHMPPKGKRQLEKGEIEVLERWIASGLHF